eukprot:8833499-Pyramimonas_sp.AAC.1
MSRLIKSVKVAKAHLSLEEEGAPESDMRLRRGSFQADRAAKAGVRLHQAPSDDMSRALDRTLLVAKTVCKLAAALLFKWPRLDLKDVERVAPVGRARDRHPDRPVHVWECKAGRWRCN